MLRYCRSLDIIAELSYIFRLSHVQDSVLPRVCHYLQYVKVVLYLAIKADLGFEDVYVLLYDACMQRDVG